MSTDSSASTHLSAQPRLADLQEALECSPQNPAVHAAWLQLLFAQKNHDQAQIHWQQNLHAVPESPALCYWVGRHLEALKRPQDALKQYRRALQLSPQDARSQLQLARLCAALDQRQQALEGYTRYKNLCPQDQEVLLEFASFMDQIGAPQAAADLCWDLFQAQPNSEAALQRWFEYQLRLQPELLLTHLIEVAVSTPSLRTDMALKACAVLKSLNEAEEMRGCLDLALEDPSLPDRLAHRLLRALVFAYIPSSTAEIQDYAQHCLSALQAIQAELQTRPSPALIAPDYHNLQPYWQLWEYLAYQCYLNIDILPQRRCFAQIFEALLPPLSPRALVSPVTPPPDPAPHLVFVLNSNSAIQAFMLGIFRHWPQPAGRVTLVYTAPAKFYEKLSQARPDFEHRRLPENVPEMLTLLQGLQADLIFFSEVHTDRLVQSLLASHRLAPVQVTSWLSSGTTGLSQMDYYLSSHLLEGAAPQALYSETLVLLNEIPAYFSAPTAAPQRYPRSDYGLPESGHLYLCPHLMFKLHPDFDAILAQILEQDPEGLVVLLARPETPVFRQRLLQRLQAQYATLMPRIWFMPRMEYPDFLGLLQLADVMLDPFYFGGGTTSFEALGLGVPIVTWPGERLHGRITAAYYRKMGLHECIAQDPADYVRRVLRLGTDARWNQELRQALHQKSPAIFDNQAAVQELADCLLTLAQGNLGPGKTPHNPLT